MQGQRGVALALVVWFIAGMTLLVAGIVSVARVETQGTQLHLAKAKVVAAGDGAIRLAMVERAAGFQAGAEAPLISESLQRVGELDVQVRIYPGDGLIDVNYASRDLLAALFSLAGGLPASEAQVVADNVVKWRDPQAGMKGADDPLGFESIEDLLRVEGVTRALLDGIRDYVVPGNWLRGSADWSAAPQELLAMLQSVNPELAEQAQRRRQVLSGGDSSKRINDGGSQSLYRADALVEYAGRTWLRRRWLRPGSGRDSYLPWVVARTEAPRVVSGLQQEESIN